LSTNYSIAIQEQLSTDYKMSEAKEAVSKINSEVEQFEADKLKHVSKADADSPALAQAKIEGQIKKGVPLKHTETEVKAVLPTAEDIAAEKAAEK
jgi:hypothetical protein